MKKEFLTSPSKRIYFIERNLDGVHIKFKQHVSLLFTSITIGCLIFIAYAAYSFYLKNKYDNWEDFFISNIALLMMLPILWVCYYFGQRKIELNREFLTTYISVFGMKILESKALTEEVSLEIKDKDCIRVHHSNDYFTIDSVYNSEDAEWLIALLNEELDRLMFDEDI